MKKILSTLLAFAMVLALFSGVVVFNASAEIENDDVWMSIPFVNQYTDAELLKMVVSGNNSIHNDYWSDARNASNVTLTKDEQGRVVFNATTGSELYYGRSYFVWSTSARANPIKKVGLINSINVFGDAELSNKKGIAIKFGGNDTFFAQLKKVNLTLNSSKQIAIVKLENGVKQGDYYVYDFAGATYDSGNSNTVFSIPETYDGILDSVNFAMQFGTASSEIQFWIEDFCVIGETDSRLLYNDIANGKANGLDVTAAEAVYKDPTATQEQINAARGLMSGAIMHLPLINQYTLSQAAKMGVKNGWQSTAKNLSNVTYSKDAQGKLIISATTPAEGDQWGLYGYISTAKNATFYNRIDLIDSVDIFGDAEISNKSKLAIKVNGDAAFQSAFNKISQVTLGTSQTLPSDDNYHGVVVYAKSPTKINGYWVFDLSALTVNGYDRSGIDTIDKAYDGIVDSITMNFAFKTASPSVDVKFWIEDAFLIGAADTTELHRAIRDAKAANVDAALISSAETVYKDTATTQEQVDAQTAILKSALNADAFDKDYIFQQLPGIQNWTQATVDAYNAQSALAGSDSGTKAELVNHHTVGQATQALKLELGTNTPNSWSAVFSTSSNVADRAAVSQLGDIFGDYKAVNKMNAFDGIRIAIQNSYGDKPSFNAASAKQHIVQLMLVGSGAKSWNNTSYPYATDKTFENNPDDPDNAYTAVYHDGYYYFYFKDFVSGWSSSTKFFEKYGGYSWIYDNIKLIVQTSNFNSSSSYNGGALYLSDMQLFRTGPADKTALGEAIATLTGLNSTAYASQLAAAQAVYDEYAAFQSEVDAQTDIINGCIKEAIIGNYWEYNYTPESWAPLAQAAAALDVDAAAAAKANLVPANVKTVTGNLMEGWTTDDVNATVTANSDKLCDSIGEGLNVNGAWNAGDFSRNTTFAADGNLSMTATADFTGKAMGWKNMDRSQTLQPDENGAFPALNVAGLSKAEGIRFKLEADKPVERILIGLSNCAPSAPFSGHREMYAMKIKPEYVAADGYINIPFSYFEAAFWSAKFAQTELENVIVFIIEAYGAENGTTVAVSDLRGYKTIVAPTQADVTALETEITKLQGYDFDNKYADLIAEAEAAKSSVDQDDVLEATAAVKEVNDKFDAVDRSALKANIDAVKAIDATLWATEIAAGVDAYYDLDAAATDIAAAAKVLQRIIDKPETPVVEMAETTDTSITVTPITGAKYKLNDGEWQDSNVFTGLLPNTAYAISAYIAENDDHIASDVSVAVEITTAKGSVAGTVVTISGTERYDEVLTATVTDVPEYLGGVYAIEWRNEAGETVGTGETYTIAAADIGSFVYAVVVSDNALDTVASDPTGTIGKGVIKGYTLPTASAIQYPQTVGDSVLSGADTGIVTGTWSWVTPDAQPLSSQTGSAFDVVFTPDANFIDLYEIIEARVVLTVNPAPYEPASLEDEDTNTDLVVTGEFMQNVEMHVTEITHKEPAYLALLRASGKDNSGLPKLVLFKSFSFTVNGEEIDDVYDGDLTVTSYVGTSRAGQTVSAWFFIDGKPVNYEGTVDAAGILTVTGVKL
ncbi:MAG: hypothetical protein J5441_03395 [Clostridia bacterium]|nr:hypothetical protein [Clostridia bacterium]